MKVTNEVSLRVMVQEKCRHGMMFQAAQGAIYMLVRTEKDYLGFVSLSTGQSWEYKNYNGKLLHEHRQNVPC